MGQFQSVLIHLSLVSLLLGKVCLDEDDVTCRLQAEGPPGSLAHTGHAQSVHAAGGTGRLHRHQGREPQRVGLRIGSDRESYLQPPTVLPAGRELRFSQKLVWVSSQLLICNCEWGLCCVVCSSLWDPSWLCWDSVWRKTVTSWSVSPLLSQTHLAATSSHLNADSQILKTTPQVLNLCCSVSNFLAPYTFILFFLM